MLVSAFSEVLYVMALHVLTTRDWFARIENRLATTRQCLTRFLPSPSHSGTSFPSIVRYVALWALV